MAPCNAERIANNTKGSATNTKVTKGTEVTKINHLDDFLSFVAIVSFVFRVPPRNG
jgi:hypothetical protein